MRKSWRVLLSSVSRGSATSRCRAATCSPRRPRPPRAERRARRQRKRSRRSPRHPCWVRLASSRRSGRQHRLRQRLRLRPRCRTEPPVAVEQRIEEPPVPAPRCCCRARARICGRCRASACYTGAPRSPIRTLTGRGTAARNQRPQPGRFVPPTLRLRIEEPGQPVKPARPLTAGKASRRRDSRRSCRNPSRRRRQLPLRGPPRPRPPRHQVVSAHLIPRRRGQRPRPCSVDRDRCRPSQFVRRRRLSRHVPVVCRARALRMLRRGRPSLPPRPAQRPTQPDASGQ